MRTVAISFLILFHFSSAQADSVVLSRSNKQGVTAVDRLTKEAKGFSLNNEKLPKSKEAVAETYWLALQQMKSSPVCPAGKFVILKEVGKGSGKEVSQVSGCAMGPEYGALIDALYKLK